MPGAGQRTGITNLPLHYGKVPLWLFGQMCQLAREITIVTVTEFGTGEMLRRLSDPCQKYFQTSFKPLAKFSYFSSRLRNFGGPLLFYFPASFIPKVAFLSAFCECHGAN